MDWKKIVAGVAPTIATALGGPLAGTAIKYLAGALLGNENAKEEEIEAAIVAATPADLLKLKEIDNDFRLEMKKLDIDLATLGVENTKSARELFKVNIWPQICLSILFVVGYFALVFTMFWLMVGKNQILDGASLAMVNMLLGVLTVGIPIILKFWFGGSPQDAAQMDRIYNSIPQK